MKSLIRKSLILSVLLLSAFVSYAQNISDLIISEVVAEPDSTGLVDEYGQRNGWIEIFNDSWGTVNFGGCFVSNDPNNLKMTQIPKGDLRTKLGSRQSTVLYGSGDSNKGTFHLNFKIEKGSTIYLVSNDGRTIIDSIEVPADLPYGMANGKFANDVKEKVFDEVKVCSPTPYSMNDKSNTKTKAQKMKETDPHGWILTVTAVSVVFSALIILFLIYSLSGAIFSGKFKKAKEDKPKKAAALKKGDMNPEIAAAIAMAMDKEFGSEVYAAIGLALDQYFNDTVHDQESFILTIKPSEQTGWTNKSLNFRKRP